MEDIEILKLENRILFEAGAAAEIVAAADAAQGNTDTSDSDNNEETVLAESPVNTADQQNGSAYTEPSEPSDYDAKINSLINGILPAVQDAQADFADDNAFATVTLRDNGMTVSTGKELVVLNGSVKDRDLIISQIKVNQDVLILENGDGLQELQDYLDSQDTIYSAIHFVTHGTNGEIVVNGDVIDNETFDSASWKNIGEHLTEDGDILFYGCYTAQGESGQLLIDKIADASGADVAASTNATGISGDWNLEYTTGAIESIAVSVDGYTSDLAEIVVSDATELENALTTAIDNGGDYTITITQDITVDNELFGLFYQNLDLTIQGKSDDISLSTDGGGIFFFDTIEDNININIVIDNLDFAGQGTESALWVYDIDSLTVTDSQFSGFGNGAVYYGSYDGSGSLEVSNTEFLNNSKSGDGAAILADGVSVSISNSYFEKNAAIGNGYGGAIAIKTAEAVKISNTAFYKNSAHKGGAVYLVSNDCTLDIANATFYENTAQELGGALALIGSGTFTVSDATMANNTVTSTTGIGSAIYNDAGSLLIRNSLLIGDSSDVLHQELDGATTLEYSFATSSGGQGTIILGTGSEVDSAFTASAVFGDNTYDTTTHTIAPDAFHKVSWSGIKISDYDQTGTSRDVINTATGLTGKYSIGAVTAATGFQVVQNDYSTPYTGVEITPEEHLSLSYADGTALAITVNAVLTANPTPVKDIGTYTITPSNAYIAEIPTGSKVAYKYTPGTLTVYNWGDLVIQKNDFTYTYSDTMPLQSQYTFDTEDLRTADPTDKVTITVNVQWQIINGKVTYSSSGNINVSEYADSLAVQSFTAVDGNGNDMSSFYTWNTKTVSDLTVDAKKLTVTIDGSLFNKVYDTTAATEASDNNYATDQVAGDSIVVSGTFSYDNKNANTDKTVTFSGLTLSGTDAGNYYLDQTEASDNNAVITPYKLNVNVVLPTDKVYDGTDNVDSKVTLNDVFAGDNVVISAEWKYNSSDVISADTINNVIWQISGDDAANYELPDVSVYDKIAAVISPKDVVVTFETDAPYYYTGADQSDTVSASYVDINGNKVNVQINWNGKEFINVGSYLITVEGKDSNYNLIDKSMVLVMNPAPIKPGFNVYSDGVNPIYSASVPVLQGQLLANGEATGDIYTYTWAQLISKALRPKESIAFDCRVYPGMSYDTFLANKRVTVDTLKYCPFELDAPVKELSLKISGSENLLNFALGKELFTDSNLQQSDYILFEKREDTLSEYHDPIYVEWDYTSDKSNDQAVNIVPQTLQIPAKLLETVSEEACVEYDVPALAVHHNKADNLKTDFEKLLCELTSMA